MMLRVKMNIDFSDSIKKCSNEIDSLVINCEDLEDLSEEQRVVIANIVYEKLTEYFGDVKTNTIGELE